ncbi:MAG: hypothetical protein EXQ58_12330 [Acidobacteria bacterium]|nr:hypothetical protein [Acidobacteriota bacterium]
MRTNQLLFLVSVLVLLGGCAEQQTQQAAQPAPEYITTLTVRDLMDGIVDPSADVIWDAVSTTISAKGTEEHMPRTDEEWAEVRRSAIRLLEATNLLVIPGRHIAKPGQKADNPELELAPERIEEMVNADRTTWANHVKKLHEATMVAFDAIEKKDTEGLLISGDGIDQACESCHLQYWYPDDAARQNAQQQGLSQQSK